MERGFEFQLREVFCRGYKPFSSNFKIACIKTLAPFAISGGVVNSFGEWLIPPTLATLGREEQGQVG
jgi:hypothetical protein